jgi:DNA-binding LacI/PurR family transcriptional regulator
MSIDIDNVFVALVGTVTDLQPRPAPIVVGFDNMPESALTTPPLTTVNQPMQEMGSRAVDLLIHLMNGTEQRGTRVRLPAALVERG